LLATIPWADGCTVLVPARHAGKRNLLGRAAPIRAAGSGANCNQQGRDVAGCVRTGHRASATPWKQVV